ncbi:hypothetical protein BJ973_008770 [Actinoplanes tereljensis]|uniref:DUF6745 domain-containing protein n=1 Tax=Paractinoplanes tereljensis TaxID=571912 RepID=A0A919NGN4_9ACTN|nr:hypothetical protein [Actinoplanes tereljensis]GIF18271.1 hypothetical protein Ate02nite_10010 [Actinoplanes tereljensis]
MIATARRAAALQPGLWAEAIKIRDEWLDLGLSTEPADRPATEEAIASIYASHRRARPEFIWVLSPVAAVPHLAGLPTHQTLRSYVSDRRPQPDGAPGAGKPSASSSSGAGKPSASSSSGAGKPSAGRLGAGDRVAGRASIAGRGWPIASDIAAGLSHLRSRMAATYVEPSPDRKPMQRPKGKPWPSLRPEAALDAGLPFHELLHQGVREALFRTLAGEIYNPIRAAVPGFPSRDQLPVCWYGHQDAAWIGHADTLHRLGLASPVGAFSTWATLARSGGWWWPGEQHCVLVDRPAVIRTEPVPGAWHGERRRQPGLAVEYRDGWSM